MHFLIPALLFIIDYWSFPSSPIRDIYSPLVTLLLLDRNNGYIINLWLLFDSCADYLMDKNNLKSPIILFSISHLLKQIAFLGTFSVLNDCFIGVTMIFMLGILTTKHVVPCYAVVIGISCIHVCLLNNNAIFGYLIFCLSDLLIAVELLGMQLKPRQLRVIGVPLLYWIAQYMLIKID